MNQGAWYQIRHHLEFCLSQVGSSASLHYAGRGRSPAPACGHFNTHVQQQNALVELALTGKFNGNLFLE